MTPAASSRTPSSIPTKDWRPAWIACAKPWLPAACRCGSIWTNAKIYRSPQLARIAASLGMLIVHTPPYQPQGRGKIERFFRSTRQQFLANLDRPQTLTLEELNERLGAWIDVYHRTEHSALGTTPLARWQRDIEHIRQLPPATDFHRLFFHRLHRLVRRDCTFLLANRFYEAPPHLAGETVEVRFRPARHRHGGDLLPRGTAGRGTPGRSRRQRPDPIGQARQSP